MDYGIMIRNARETLGLYQRDLSQDKFSSNLLSNIEKGKTNLTKQKAMMLYTKILEFSWKKNIFPELNFDELMENDVEYVTLRRAHHLCIGLKDKIRLKECIDAKEYIFLKDFAHNEKIGMLSYYLYRLIVQSLAEDMTSEKLETYHDILDFLRWENLGDNTEEFRSNLEASIPYSYVENKIGQTLTYYYILLEAQKKYNYRVDSNTYYNLVIFNKREKNYDESYKFLNKYLKSKSYLSLEEEAEIKILEASLMSNIGKNDESLKLYSDLSKRLVGENLENLEVLCYSNSIYRICKHNLSGNKNTVIEYLDKINDILDKVLDHVSLRSLYSNMAQGYCLIDSLAISKEYFLKALENTDNCRSDLIVLEEALSLFVKLNELDFIVDRLYILDLASLQLDETLMLYEMIIRLTYLNNSNDISIDIKKLERIFMRISR